MENLSQSAIATIEQIKKDAQFLYEFNGIKKNPVQCGVTHAGFAKWVLYKYNLDCEFRSIKESDLPSEYKSSQGSDDETFLLINMKNLDIDNNTESQIGQSNQVALGVRHDLHSRDQFILIDICATPEDGPYVGPNIYDLSKTYLWTIEFPQNNYNPKKYDDISKFFKAIHYINLGCPIELRHEYSIFWRG